MRPNQSPNRGPPYRGPPNRGPPMGITISAPIRGPPNRAYAMPRPIGLALPTRVSIGLLTPVSAGTNSPGARPYRKLNYRGSITNRIKQKFRQDFIQMVCWKLI